MRQFSVSRADGPLQRQRILVISQTFIPDPAAVGQYMVDVARELVRRGYEVRVYASERGYEYPNMRYLRHEFIEVDGGKNIEICRIPFASFGKNHMLVRILGTASFQIQVLWHQLMTTRVRGIFFSTSPPLVGVTACIAKLFRRIPIVYWVMDLNPDQLIEMGKIKERSFTARFLEVVNRLILRQSNLVLALDRFMHARLLKRGDFSEKMVVLPPWPHDEHIEDIDQAANPFRAKHGLIGKCVIMYSGNHSPANPLDTLLRAAVAFKDDDRVRFVFVGGGLGKKDVETCIQEYELRNMLSLPYQPLAELKYSLSAADVHVVSMGQAMAGIIHPSKIYGAMSVGRPVLYLGPSPSHISDILDAHYCGWQVSHGNVDAMKACIKVILAAPTSELKRMGEFAQEALHNRLSKEILLGRMGDYLSQTFPPAHAWN